MALIGNIENFTPGGDFDQYVVRMNQLLLVNSVEDKKKVPLFLTFIGPETFDILTRLLYPKDVTGEKYEDITKILSKHFKPNKIEMAETFKFFKCDQKHNESINDYVVELKMLASSCNFGEFLPRALRDKFVVGLKDETLQAKLLNEKDLTFSKAVEIASGYEMTGLEQREMKSQPAVHASRAFKPQTINRNVRTSPARIERYSSGRGNSMSSPSSSPNRVPRTNLNCDKCGRNHDINRCPARNWTCFRCGRRGHSKNVCFTDLREVSNKNITVNAIRGYEALQVEVVILDVNMFMEIDCGASFSVIDKYCYKKNFNQIILENCSYQFVNVISGDKIVILGTIRVTVCVRKEKFNLMLMVLDTAAPFTPIMGRDWLEIIYPEWRSVFTDKVSIKSANRKMIKGNEELLHVNQVTNLLNELKLAAPKVFDDLNNDPIIGFEATILIKENVLPKFCKAYSVPFHLRDKVNSELDRLVDEKVLIPVSYSDWASPIVVVQKDDNRIRICGDFSVTINRVISMEHYPLPVIDEVFAGLAGFKCFCVLDLSGAYLQLSLSESSKQLLTINTLKGLFQFQRLPFGISSATSIFQRVMDQVLLGVQGVTCYIDDILIGGVDSEDCERKLKVVIKKLQEFNIKVNLNKCQFFKNSVEYLGHIISEDGLKTNKKKVEAVLKAPSPKTVDQLHSFLGLINYYSKFVPNLSTLVNPLYRLLKKDEEFVWSQECANAFEAAKKEIASQKVLTFFDPKKQLILICDASSYGVGAVLAHEINGVERPIMFASSTLSRAEQNYSQTHREALAIIFAIQKFSNYLLGNRFVIFTDHKSLMDIFNQTKGLPVVAAQRMQRWSIFLAAYCFDIKYRKSSLLKNADALSRLPLTNSTNVEDYQINRFNCASEIPLSYDEMAKEIKTDKKYLDIKEFITRGWPASVPVIYEKYYRVRDAISCDEIFLFYGDRILVPSSYRIPVLRLLHDQHVGIVRMKKLARSCVWWPDLDKEIELFVKNCMECNANQRNTKDCDNAHWSATTFPFERIHMDLFHYGKFTCLLVVDDFSKWMDVYLINNYNAFTVISKLKDQFSIFGTPHEVVSDNGPPFSSAEFKNFLLANGIKVTNSPPYHPQSNGLAERGVQTIKNSLRKNVLTNDFVEMENQIFNFLFKYRNTPLSVTGLSPAEVIFSYKPKTLITLLNPKINKNKNVRFNLRLNDYIEKKKNKSKSDVNNDNDNVNNDKNFELEVEEEVWYKLWMGNKIKWIKAKVKNRVSKFVYYINVRGSCRLAHRNQLKKICKTDIYEYYPTRNIIDRNDGSCTSKGSAQTEQTKMKSQNVVRSRRFGIGLRDSSVLSKPNKLNI